MKEKRKMNKGLVILIVVVSIPVALLALEVACVFIKIIAPNCGFSLFVDNILTWLIQRFTG